jgi:hypothetical protein
MKRERLPIWVCDRCEKEYEGESYPQTASNNWGRINIEQNAGFDHQGCAHAPRMRNPLLLCGECIEDVISVINNTPH